MVEAVPGGVVYKFEFNIQKNANIMKLGYFTMPMHPLERNPTDTLREDRERQPLSNADAVATERRNTARRRASNSRVENVFGM